MKFKEELRLHLTALGFVPSVTEDGITGVIYFYRDCSPSIDIDITVDLSKMEATATYPDYEYNKRNPYSRKDVKTAYAIQEEFDFHNFDRFFELSLELSSKK